MDSFHACRIVAQHPLPSVHDDVYPVLFKAAFLDRRPLALRDLVATWPFPELHLQQLVGHLELDLDRNYEPCIEAIIQGVVSQLRRELEEPGSDSSRCRLRVLDITGDLPIFGVGFWSCTEALAMACVEVSKHQKELQRHQPKQHKGCSGAITAPPQLLGMDVHTDLFVERNSYKILRKALQTKAAQLLRLKCRDFKAWGFSAAKIVTLLKSLDPSCLRRVELRSGSFELTGLWKITPHLLRFPELHSLMIQLHMLNLRSMTPELAMRIHDVARHLGMLPGLRELSLGMTDLSGNLHQILCYLQAPLESLDLHGCFLVPDDLTFLSQSFHAPALKRLDLHGNYLSQGLLEPLRLLLEKASASLLYLDLSDCHIADSHLAVLLPALLRCSRLRFLGLFHNPLSMAALKGLLQKTLELPDLHQVLYPIPLDCRRPGPLNFMWSVVPDEERLVAAKAEFSQILVNSGRTDLIWSHDPKDHKAMDYFSLCFRKSSKAGKAQSLHYGKTPLSPCRKLDVYCLIPVLFYLIALFFFRSFWCFSAWFG